MVLKSITFFEDAENEEMPILFQKIDWNRIKDEILLAEKKLI